MAHNKVYGFCESKCKVEIPSLEKHNQDLQNIQDNVNQGLQGLSQGLQGLNQGLQGLNQQMNNLNAMQFTFIVDSNESLSNWANNVSGNDYTSVLIKKGTWTSSVGVNLTTTGTKVVVGEAGSHLVFNKVEKCLFYDEIPSRFDYYMFGVTLSPILDYAGDGVDGNYGFHNCISLTNCTVESGILSGVSYIYGFSNCAYLTNCQAQLNGTSYGVKASNVFGFNQCENLTNCMSSGTGKTKGYGFYYCKGVFKCKAHKHCTSDVFYQSFATHSQTNTYICADTPEGGFNYVTNPSA